MLVRVMLHTYQRVAPFLAGPLSHSAGPARHSDQVESPLGMRLVRNISGNRGLENGYRLRVAVYAVAREDKSVLMVRDASGNLVYNVPESKLVDTS
jgi:hypothetical protein